jgi:imidazolonepropionase-like amidohydrolase
MNATDMTTRVLLLAALLASAPGAAQAQVALRGETVYTMAGPPLHDAVVLIRDGRVERVGLAAEVAVPAGYRLLMAKVVTPGLVDAHSVVGLAGLFNVPHDQQQLERSNPIQPELRALDAYNPREELVAWLRSLGVTTLHTGHGPGALASGQTMIVKTHGETLDAVLVDSAAMVAFTIGPDVAAAFDNKPGTRAKGVAMLREAFVRAQDYGRKRAGADVDKRPAPDLKLETLVQVLDGTLPALVTAQQAPEIQAALRLAREFGFRLVLDGAAEAYLLLDEIRAAGVPVILHPTMARADGATVNVSFETAARLRQAGIPFALQSGYEAYVPKTRVVLFEAALAAANGLAFEDALRSITLDAARILGVGDRVGSLEPGKDGDAVLFDGDPFEYTTHVCAVVVEGTVVSETCR